MLFNAHSDNMFESKCEALVIPVNTVGVMGAGIARVVKDVWPAVFTIYRDECMKNKLKPGEILVIDLESTVPPHYMYLFATKKHYWNPSEMAWIKIGLQDLFLSDVLHEVKSVAMPAIGCGLGGLDWDEVKEWIDYYHDLSPYKNITTIELYDPR